MIKIKSMSVIHGPNVFAHKPVLVMRIDLGTLGGVESNAVDGFIERLLAALPGLQEHRCSRRRVGGFVERLREGTFFGHVIEHVALELSELAGIGVYFGKTAYSGKPGQYEVVTEYASEPAMRHLLKESVGLVNALVSGEAFDLNKLVEDARDIAADADLGPTTKAIIAAAEKRGIPWRRINDESLIQLGYGKRRKFIEAAISSDTSAVSVDVSCDKAVTKRLLEEASIPVPWGRTVRTAEEALEALAELRAPAAVKPLDGRQGKGVSLNVTSEAECLQAFEVARSYSSRVLVEEQFTGKNFRVLVVGDRVVAASERIPANVVGDGKHSVRELVDIANQDPRRGVGHEKPMTRIPIDEIALATLAKQGLGLDSVPESGVTVLMRDGANLSTGGIARDVTDVVHPATAAMCVRAAAAIGLNICGIDLLADDISRELSPSNGVIELNAAPGIRMHLYPAEGVGRDVGTAIIDMMYPEHSSARIPVVSVTGTNGKTTTARLIAHVLKVATGGTIGTTTTDGIYIGERCIVKGDTTGPRSARTVLSDPTVDYAVLETARGGIMRSGLAYDWSDVGVITNVQADHLGQDGLETIEDLVDVKALIAERVRPGGDLVLNADDPSTPAILERRRVKDLARRIHMFASSPDSPLIKNARLQGQKAYFVKRGWVVEAFDGVEHLVVPVASLSLTMGGTAKFQIENLLAAVAACRALGVERRHFAEALKAFDSSHDNPGRVNLFRVGNGHVLVDYGHNPASIRAIARMVASWSTRVTGVVGVPGDRSNDLIIEAGHVIANAFDRVIIKDDVDLRGRRPGEVARLLQQAIQRSDVDLEQQIVLSETDAVAEALSRMEEGETVVVFYEKLHPIIKVLEAHGAVPIGFADLRPSPSKAPSRGERATTSPA